MKHFFTLMAIAPIAVWIVMGGPIPQQKDISVVVWMLGVSHIFAVLAVAYRVEK